MSIGGEDEEDFSCPPDLEAVEVSQSKQATQVETTSSSVNQEALIINQNIVRELTQAIKVGMLIRSVLNQSFLTYPRSPALRSFIIRCNVLCLRHFQERLMNL